MGDQQRLGSACADAQSDQSLCWSLAYSMSVKLLTEHHLEFLSLKGDYTGSSDSIHVKIQYNTNRFIFHSGHNTTDEEKQKRIFRAVVS